MTNKFSIAVCLFNSESDYEVQLKEDALEAGRIHRLNVEVEFSESQVPIQIKKLYDFISRGPGDRPLALLVHPYRDAPLDRVAREAIKNGIGWIFLNRGTGYLKDYRKDYPDLPIFTVTPDQHEIGRVQGRQFKALLRGWIGSIYSRNIRF